MKEVVLVNIEVNSDGIYSIAQSNEMYLVKKYLESEGVKTFQYIEEILPNINDLVDEILSYSEKSVIFSITRMNYSLVKSLSEILKEQSSDIEIIGFGADDYLIKNRIEELNLDIYIFNNYLSNIKNAITNMRINTRECIDFESVYLENNNEKNLEVDKKIFSFNNIEGIKECEAFTLKLSYKGSNISIDIIENNIRQLKNKKIDVNITLNWQELINLDKPYLSELVSIIKEANICSGLILKTEDTSIDYLNNGGISIELKAIKIIAKNIEEANKRFSNILKNTNAEVTIEVCEFDLEKDRGILDLIVKKSNFKKLRVFKVSEDISYRCVFVNTKDNIHNIAIENGLMMWYQGSYPENALNNTVKHVYISGSLEKESLKELDKLVSVNHALIIKEEVFNKGYSLDYGKHRHLVRNKSQSGIEVVVDEGAFIKEYKNARYKNARNIKIEKSEDLLINILDEEDLNMFISDVQIFNRTGKIPEYMARGIVKNMCRFANKGKCQLSGIPRIDVSGEGSISCCDSNVKLGVLGDDYFDIMNEIYKKGSSEALYRKCVECSAKQICGGCKLLPQDIKKETYCNHMRTVKGIDRFIMSSLVVKTLKDVSIIFKDTKISDITIINKSANNLFNKKIKDNLKSIVKENIVLIKFEEKFIIFDLLTSSIIGISPIVAYTIEGYMKGYSLEEIKKISIEEYKDSIDIDKYIDEANVQLMNSRIIEGCV